MKMRNNNKSEKKKNNKGTKKISKLKITILLIIITIRLLIAKRTIMRTITYKNIKIILIIVIKMA